MLLVLFILGAVIGACALAYGKSLVPEIILIDILYKLVVGNCFLTVLAIVIVKQHISLFGLGEHLLDRIL